MENWITIKTFILPSEAVILKGRLEAEEIECLVTNEFTTQINPLYSNAIGGVQLQVKENKVERAITILKEAGYNTDYEPQPSKLLIILNNITAKIPFLKNISLFYRILILITAITITAISYISYSTLPSTYERIISDSWCLNYVEFENKNYIPQTEDFLMISINGVCDESISFKNDGTVILPGFKSKSVSANWSITNKKLIISGSDSFEYVYNGIYLIDLRHNKLVLTSDKTILNCHTQTNHINFPFQ